MFEFSILKASGAARHGVFETPHGKFETPCFMPCGTKGAVKTLTPDELTSLGCEVVLANTYHLMLRPGAQLIADMGGLHQWTGWKGPMLTDSGGFQVFSLSNIRRVNENGVEFQSILDGSLIFLTPEKCMEIQEALGADIIMVLDECASAQSDKPYAREAMERTHAWAVRCFQAKRKTDQALFPIVQGVTYDDVRRESAEFVAGLQAPGNAIGGLAVGEEKEKMFHIVSLVNDILPKEKPRYLMGVGSPEDIVQAVSLGIDMFDCVLPTRLARHGAFWDMRGRKNIRLAEFERDSRPLMEGCRCFTCQRFSKSYLRHLMQEGEMLGPRLLTMHNLAFLLDLMRKIRSSISQNSFATFARTFLETFTSEHRELSL